MLSLPNLLTLSRILAVPILVFLLWPGAKHLGVQPVPLDYWLAFGLYCLMGITDYFDGYLARAQGTVSKLGVFLDPIADKIMVAAVILMLVFTRDVDGWHVIAALIILLREMIVSGLARVSGRASGVGAGVETGEVENHGAAGCLGRRHPCRRNA